MAQTSFICYHHTTTSTSSTAPAKFKGPNFPIQAPVELTNTLYRSSVKNKIKLGKHFSCAFSNKKIGNAILELVFEYTANLYHMKTTGTGNCGIPAGKICTIYGKGL